MGKKDVNEEIDGEAIKDVIEAIEEKLSEIKSIVEKSSVGESSKDPEESKKIEIVVGSKVKWEDGEGKVIKIKGDVATIEDDEEDEHKVDLEDLELIVEKKSEPKSSKKESKIEVGSEVEWEDEEGESCEGEVIKIKGETATVEDDDGDEHKVDLKDLELA